MFSVFGWVTVRLPMNDSLLFLHITEILYGLITAVLPCRNHKGQAPVRPGPFMVIFLPPGAGPKQALSLFVLDFEQRIATSCLILCTK